MNEHNQLSSGTLMSIETELSSLVALTMSDIWNLNPQLQRSKAICHLLKMMLKQAPMSPLLIFQSTGSGKSAICLIVTTIEGCICVVIQNTLTLGSDQHSKIRNSNLKQHVL